jgi:hypothetical protein
MAGPRRPRFPFFAAGVLLVGVGVVFLLFAIVKGGGDLIEGAVKILVFLSAFAAPLFFMGKRGAVSLDEVARRDPRSSVLYLRPFIQEGDVFVAGPNSRFGSYTSSWQRSLSGLGDLSFGGENALNPDPQVTVRFEQYFSNVFTQRIGPFVALGNPEDYTQPEGAVRMYASDTDWQSHVERLAGNSSCIVTEVAGSNNLKWELDYLRQHDLHRKLFVFTKPAKVKPYKLYPLIVWLKGGTPEVKWSDYAASMAASGYQLPDDPGPGAVLAFDETGQAVTLTTGAQSPEDFVEPIRSLLESRGYSSESLDPPVTEPLSTPPLPEQVRRAEVKASKASIRWTRIKASNWWTTTWFLVVIVALAFGVPLARRLIADRQDSSRATALKELAPQIGLTLLQDNETFGDAELLASSRFSDIKKRAFSNVMQGQVNDLHAILFDDRYEWQTQDDDGAGKTTHQLVETIAAFSHPSRKLARFKVRENTFSNYMNATDDPSEIVSFQEYPDFAKRFVVTSDEIEETRRLFSAPLREFLLHGYPHGYRMEGSGSWLLIYEPDNRAEPKQWRSFLQESSKVAGGFFQNSGSAN